MVARRSSRTGAWADAPAMSEARGRLLVSLDDGSVVVIGSIGRELLTPVERLEP